jgi:hypothetical protein
MSFNLPEPDEQEVRRMLVDSIICIIDQMGCDYEHVFYSLDIAEEMSIAKDSEALQALSVGTLAYFLKQLIQLTHAPMNSQTEPA